MQARSCWFPSRERVHLLSALECRSTRWETDVEGARAALKEFGKSMLLLLARRSVDLPTLLNPLYGVWVPAGPQLRNRGAIQRQAPRGHLARAAFDRARWRLRQEP